MGIWSSANRSISLPFHVLGSLLLTPYDHCVHIPIITNTYLVIQRSCTCSTLYVACAALPFYPIYSLTALLTTHLPKAVKEVGRTRIDYRPLTEVHTLEGIPGFDFCGLALQLSLSAQDVYHADRLKRQSGLFGR